MPRYYQISDIKEILQGFVRIEGNQTKAAQKLGITSSYLSDVLNGKRSPGPSILSKIGLDSVVVYVTK